MAGTAIIDARSSDDGNDMAGKDLDIVVMAAGKGTRMRSQHPKVLHRLAGKSLLQHVLATAAALGPRRVVAVTGFGADAVEASVSPSPALAFVRQEPQLGTGHAVQQAVWSIDKDQPMWKIRTLQSLVDRSFSNRRYTLVLLGGGVEAPPGS